MSPYIENICSKPRFETRDFRLAFANVFAISNDVPSAWRRACRRYAAGGVKMACVPESRGCKLNSGRGSEAS